MTDRAARDDALELIAPLIEYHVREMGEVAGRLMVALSLLTDLEESHGWDGQPVHSRETVRYARLLVASAFRIVTSAQAGQADALAMSETVEAQLRHLFAELDGSREHE